MSKVGQIERVTQNRIVQLFHKQLGYTYLGNWEERPNNKNIEEDLLRPFLIDSGYSPTLINKALFELSQAANQSKNLYDVNKEVYALLRYGLKIKAEVGENTQTVELINWKKPFENRFAIAEEVSIKGTNKKRPDIVLYVNGIALGVLELKRSTVSISEGIRQNLDNQKEAFIKPFFSTIQMVMAGNDTEGVRYGVIGTPEKYYLTWKAPILESPTLLGEDLGGGILDSHILQLCDKKLFLELLHDFIVFDRGIKKLCRHNQYFGVKAAQHDTRKREGGIIWHTQGSGKSLTMVWLTKWILENITDSRVLIITDRDELDKQIEKVFTGVDEKIYRTKSGKDLIEKLNNVEKPLLCSLVHKFGNKEEADYDDYINELKNSLPKDFKAKGDIYVFVDECHRTQSGKLHEAMKMILPNALFIGFTGTPLLSKDKQTSMEIFGKFIHTYKFDEAVRDKVVLDLRYEARNIDQNIKSPKKIDEWFAAKTKGMNEYAKAQLKQRWGTMQKLLSSKERLEQIVADIMFDMGTKDRLQNGRGNAMLVSGSIYQACKYYELFQNEGFTQCAIVTSYKPSPKDIKGESTGEGLTEKLRQYDIYNKMLNGKTPEDFEDEAKKKFTDEPAQMKLLIVVDKLLTGFDAPAATYLYIDKSMQDHGLFQAICRVNRLDGDDKEYGYIIDYKNLFDSIEGSMHDYTSDAFDGYEKADVEGLLKNRLEKAKEDLDEALEAIKMLCEPVEPPKETPQYIRYFCGDTSNKDQLKDSEQKRIALYKHTSHLIRAYAHLANEMEQAGYSPKEAEQIKKDVTHYENVRKEVKLASGDYIDLKAYEPAMRHLIDTYISADESEKISAFDELTLVQLIVERGEEGLNALPKSIRSNKQSMAETIENNLRKVIIDEMPTNPKYFEAMSTLLDELIQARKLEAADYEAYLKKVVELASKVQNPSSSTSYPKGINTKAKRALFDNLGKDENLATALDEAIRYTKKDAWRGNRFKEKEIEKIIKTHIQDSDLRITIFELVRNQDDY